MQAAEEPADQAIAVGDTGTASTLINQILDQPDLEPELRSRAALALAKPTAISVDPFAYAKRLRRILADPRLPKVVRGEIRFGLGLLMFIERADRGAPSSSKRRSRS